jgi:hypothetical protein
VLESADFEIRFRFSEAERKRAMMENIYNDKVRLLRELEKQREQTLAQLEGTKQHHETRESPDDRLTRERQEWVRQAAEKATERGRAAMYKANEWARLKEKEENYHRTRREEVMRDEAAKAKQQAADWQQRQLQPEQQVGDLSRRAKLTREEREYPKATDHKPITIKHTVTATKPKPAEHKSKPFEVPHNIGEARRKAALERGQDEMTNKQLKAEHSRLIAELEMLRRGEVKPSTTKRPPQDSKPMKREEARGRWGKVEVHEADLGSESRPKNWERNAWEKRREADETHTWHNVEVQPSSKPPGTAHHKPPAKHSTGFSSKPQSTPSTKLNKPSWVAVSFSEDEVLDKYESYVKTSFEATFNPRGEAAPDMTEGSEAALGEEEGLYSEEIDQPLLNPPYTTNSMRNDKSKLTPPVYLRSREDAEVDDEYSDLSYESAQESRTVHPDLSQRSTVRILEEDKAIKDLSAKSSAIRQMHRDVQDRSPHQDRGRVRTDSADVYRTDVSPAIRQIDQTPQGRTKSSLHQGNSAPKASPVSATPIDISTSHGDVGARGLQYYIDMLTNPSSQQPKLHDEENRGQTEASLVRDVRPREDPALQDGYRHQLKLRENERKRRSNEAADHSRVSHTKDAKLHQTKNSPPASHPEQASHAEIMNPLVKPVAWDIEVLPTANKAKSRDGPKNDSDKSPTQLQVNKPAEAWAIDLDADSPSKSLSNAFLAKKRSLAEKLEHRDLRPKEATRAKTKEELLEIRKQMMKAPTTHKVIEVDFKQIHPAKSKVMGRLASGERTKVRYSQVSKSEMKQLTARNYTNLPEVRARREEEAKKAEVKKRLANAKEFEKVRRRQ